MIVHVQKAIGDRVRAALPSLINEWQTKSPDRLLPTPYVTARAAAALDVSGGAVRKHLTDAVADEGLIEILVRRDWLIVPQYHIVPSPIYAVPDGDLYRMVCERPESRGSNGVSFLTTPDGYDRLIDVIGELLG